MRRADGGAQNDAVTGRRKLLAGLLGFVVAAALGRGGLAASSKDSLVDLNRASIDELMTLPGMTRTWAARIIRFRPYRGKNELVDRGVVTGAVYGRIKDFVIAHREKQ